MAHDITHYNQRPDVQKFYTVQETADLLDTSCDEVRRIIGYYKVKHEVVITKQSRAIMLDYDSFRLVKNVYDEKQKRKAAALKATALKKDKSEEETTGAEDHPLVTDKRWLKLNEWPDTIPDCFKECEE